MRLLKFAFRLAVFRSDNEPKRLSCFGVATYYCAIVFFLPPFTRLQVSCDSRPQLAQQPNKEKGGDSQEQPPLIVPVLGRGEAPGQDKGLRAGG